MKRSATCGAFVLAALLGARAQAATRSLGLGVGRVDPQGVDAALWFTANLRWPVGHNVVVEPEGGYWKKSVATAGGDSSVEDLNGGVNVLYRFRSKRPLGFFAGGGVGLHLVRSSFTLANAVTVSDRELKQGLHLIAGAEYALSKGLTLFAEVRHDLVADLDESKACAGVRLGL